MKLQQIEIDCWENDEKIRGVLSAPTFDPGRPVNNTLVLLMHDLPFGYCSEHEDFLAFLRGVFTEHYIQTLMFDFRGCGESDGREEAITLEKAREDIALVLSWAEKRGYSEFMLVGCGVSATLALEFTDQTTKVGFLFWPVLDMASHAKNIFQGFTLSEDGALTRTGHRIGPDLQNQMNTYDYGAALKKLRIPLLVQYGAKDKTYDQNNIDLLKNGFKALRIDITSYADGEKGLTDPRHRQMIAHHMGQFLAKYA